MGSGCGSVGRAVASNTKDPQFKSRNQENYTYQLYYRKDENKEKEAGNGPSFKKTRRHKMKQHSRLKQFSFPTAIFYFLLYFAAKKRKPIQWQIRVIQCDFFRTPSIDAQEETVGGCEQKIE